MDNNEESIVGVDDEICNNLMLTSNGWEDLIWPNVCPPQLEQQQPPPDSSGAMAGIIPSKDDFPGEFNFRYNLDHGATVQHWVYSGPLKQLYIRMNKVLVVHFQMSPVLWTLDTHFYIRALPVYSSDDFAYVPVHRCTFHSCEDDPQRKAHVTAGQCFCDQYNLVGHVIRADCHDAEYLYDAKSDRHSVRVGITHPQAGSDTISVPYSFACKTSCPKGMQRRPIHVIFTLEDEFMNVYGRQKLLVKICSCPKRDKKRQEEDYSVENKKRRLITKDDLIKALSSTKQIKVESAPESISKDDIKQQLRTDIKGLKRLYIEMTRGFSDMIHHVKRIDENFEKLMADQE